MTQIWNKGSQKFDIDHNIREKFGRRNTHGRIENTSGNSKIIKKDSPVHEA